MAKYSVGREPENIKRRLNTLFKKLDSAYPNKVIIGLHNDHKHWGDTVTELYRLLDYPDGKTFLEAYGYQYGNKEGTGGRPKTVDPQAIIKEIQKKYPNGSPYKTVDELFAEFPEYLPKLKTLKNASTAVFGLPLTKYLREIGLLKEKKADKPVVKKKYVIYEIMFPGNSEKRYYLSSTKSIHEGDCVEVPLGQKNKLCFGKVSLVIEGTEDALPCSIDGMKTITRKVTNREFESVLLRNILLGHAVIETESLIASAKSDNHTAIDYETGEKAHGEIPWACCRGLETEIFDMLEYLIEKDDLVYRYEDIILLDDGIAELYVFGNDVEDVLTRYPEIKMAMFSENENAGNIELCYSKSGASGITGSYIISDYSSIDDNRWTLHHSPVESFNNGKIQFEFKYHEDWDSLNYIFTDDQGIKIQLRK